MAFIWNSLVPWIKYSISDLAMWHVWYYAAWFSSGTCQFFSSYTKWWHLFYTTLLGVNLNKLWFICIPFLSPSNIPWHEILGLYLYPWLHFYAFPSFSFCGNTFIPSLHFSFSGRLASWIPSAKNSQTRGFLLCQKLCSACFCPLPLVYGANLPVIEFRLVSWHVLFL